jgi:hypothetical protein
MTTQTIQLDEFVCGERPNPLVYQFLDSTRNPLDLSGYTCKFEWREFDGPASILDAQVTDPTHGKVTYFWTGTEFLTPGHYRAQFWTGNSIQRYASWFILWTAALPVGSIPNI